MIYLNDIDPLESWRKESIITSWTTIAACFWLVTFIIAFEATYVSLGYIFLPQIPYLLMWISLYKWCNSWFQIIKALFFIELQNFIICINVFILVSLNMVFEYNIFILLFVWKQVAILVYFELNTLHIIKSFLSTLLICASSSLFMFILHFQFNYLIFVVYFLIRLFFYLVQLLVCIQFFLSSSLYFERIFR